MQEFERMRDEGGSEFDRWKTTDSQPWPSTDDIEDMNMASGASYCGACGYRHSADSIWCKA